MLCGLFIRMVTVCVSLLLSEALVVCFIIDLSLGGEIIGWQLKLIWIQSSERSECIVYMYKWNYSEQELHNGIIHFTAMTEYLRLLNFKK